MAASLPRVDWPALAATFPAAPVRRTWVAERLEALVEGAHFAKLLHRLAPARYRALRRRTPEAVFAALLAWCAARFPVFDPVIDDGEAFGQSYFCQHIPIPGFSVDPYEDEITSPAIALCMAMTPADSGLWYENMGLNDFGCLHDYLDALPRGTEHGAALPYAIARQRVWRPPWQGLWDLWAFAHHATGYLFLDETDASLQESESYPEWGLAEVRALVRHWRHARPIWQRLRTLGDYIDRQADERLPLLAGALRRDPDVLARLTAARRGAPRGWQNVRPARELQHFRSRERVRI